MALLALLALLVLLLLLLLLGSVSGALSTRGKTTLSCALVIFFLGGLDARRVLLGHIIGMLLLVRTHCLR
jgi:hypothetical protein